MRKRNSSRRSSSARQWPCTARTNDPKTLLRHADVAMHHAEKNGRNEFHFYSPEMNSRVLERVQLTIDDIASEPGAAAMIAAIIALAHSLKLKVIAQGVETAGQLAYLRQHGCDEYQGFHAAGAAPVPPIPRPP